MTVRLAICLWHAAFDPTRRIDRIRIERRLGGVDALARAGVAYSVSSDTRGIGCWPSWRAAAVQSLRWAPTATHHLVLADDMLPCPAFVTAIQGALAAVPANPVNLFSMRGSQDQAKAKGEHWVVSPDGLWGGAHVLPTPFLRDFLAWEASACRPDHRWDDTRVRAYAQIRRLAVYCTAPSLLQHIEPAVSLVGNGNRRRVARWYPDDEMAAAIDWKLPAAPLRDPVHESLAQLRRTVLLPEAACSR